MLNRRYLRTKVMQSLYAYFQSDENRMDIAERNLIKSIDKLYELYIYQLSILFELVEFTKQRLEENKQKYVPTEEDLNPSTKFIDNRLIKQLASNNSFVLHYNELKINWSEEQDIFRSLYQKMKETTAYIEYMNSEKSSYAADKKIILQLFRRLIISDEKLENYFEDKNIYWADDYQTVAMMVLKTLDSFTEDKNEYYELPGLYKEEDRTNANDDKNFIKELFRKTIINNAKYNEIIENHMNNWEIERIAVIDKILIKMAIVEFIDFPSIPIKVTLNEYIEISKGFSDDNSKIFINGILDKIITDLKTNKSISKLGRGLV
jgi:N utilization substance protein B